MKLLKRGREECDCWSKLTDFARAQDPPLTLGSEVECDCGMTYRLIRGQERGHWYGPNGGHWVRLQSGWF